MVCDFLDGTTSVDGRGLLIGSPIQEIEKEAEGIAGMNLEGKIIAAALH
jgi:hypothetical protein